MKKDQKTLETKTLVCSLLETVTPHFRVFEKAEQNCHSHANLRAVQELLKLKAFFSFMLCCDSRELTPFIIKLYPEANGLVLEDWQTLLETYLEDKARQRPNPEDTPGLFVKKELAAARYDMPVKNEDKVYMDLTTWLINMMSDMSLLRENKNDLRLVLETAVILDSVILSFENFQVFVKEKEADIKNLLFF